MTPEDSLMATDKSWPKWSRLDELYGQARLVTVMVLICQIAAAEKTGNAPLLWGDLQPGRYDVGFRVLYKHDRARKWLPFDNSFEASYE